MKKNILKKGISGLLGIVVIMTLFSVTGSAAVGDLLRTITTPVPAPGGVATSVGFDGASLYYTNWDQTNLYKIDAMGNLLATIPMTKSGMPLSFVTSLSWDSSRNKFWASAGGPLYLLDPNTGVAVFQFNSVGFDGLAWDGSDDTLWFSPDANPMVHHTTTAGVELAGSPFNSGISNSGIAAGLPVGGKSFLYLGSNGVGKIYKYSKPPILANQIGVFASVGGRDENLACDSASFPGKNALWSKDAYNNKLFAYEVELGTCVSPPPPGKPRLGSISGMKFNDLNGNGIKDLGEPGLAKWTITLTNKSGSVVTQKTASDGSYNFTNLTDGNYTVGEVIQPGWVQTAPAVSPTGSATYKVQISGGNAVTGKDFGNFFDIPTASCVKGPNPSGNIPPANGGQRPDGFYKLLATDKFDPNPQIFVKDMGSGTIFPLSPPGFASGTNIKYTQAPGATPSIVPFSGVVDWHITGTGDAGVYAVNFVGNPSPIVSCLVPPPPK